MFSKILASVGIGSAKVDAVLTTECLMPGGFLEGEIRATGGNVEQEIKGIELEVKTRVKYETEEEEIAWQNKRLQAFYVADAFTLQPKESRVIPFSFQLGSETPITTLGGESRVWLSTELDIDMAIDPSDKDYLAVQPTPVIQHFIDCLNNNGFEIAKTDVEKGYLNGDGFSSESGCYQEIEFRPSGFGLFSSLQEIEASFITDHEETHALIELDRRFRGDGYLSLTVPNDAPYEYIEAMMKELAGV